MPLQKSLHCLPVRSISILGLCLGWKGQLIYCVTRGEGGDGGRGGSLGEGGREGGEGGREGGRGGREGGREGGGEGREGMTVIHTLI